MILPATLPLPPPRNDREQQFWDHCRERRLAFLSCVDCGHVQHPPLPLCPACQSRQLAWRDAPHRARVYTYTIAHHAAHESLRAHLPYNIAVVSFAELDELRFVTNIVELGDTELHIGLEVELLWQDGPADLPLPRFRPVARP